MLTPPSPLRSAIPDKRPPALDLCPPVDASQHPGPLCESIARLSDEELCDLDRDDLVDLVRFSDMLPRDEEGLQRLPWLEDAELKRVAYLVRRCCRNRLNAYRKGTGRSPNWHDTL